MGSSRGLCLAVALSHALDRPLLSSLIIGLIVDDVYETGRTMKALKDQVPHASFAVWGARAHLTGARPPWSLILRNGWCFLGKS